MVSLKELALDIHEEILVRSQVKDLIRCKSVCKSWNSLISSPRFVKSQLNYTLIKNTNEIGDTRIIVSPTSTLVGSSNGLVCISRHHFTDFLVINPSTREVKELRKLPESYYEYYVYASGFGYDSSIDDFKVVIGYKFLPNEAGLMFKLLELKTNIWRSVRLSCGYDYLYGDGIVCNGAIHWLDWEKKPSAIVSFDLSKEVFKNIRLPKLDDQYDSWTLGTMKNHLCIFPQPDNNLRKNKEMEIWVMRNYNVQESWERELPPPGYEANKTTMYYNPPSEFMYGGVHIWLLEKGSRAPVLVQSIERPHEHYQGHYEHIENAHIRLSTNSECDSNYNDHVFVTSLVSPHGNGNCNEGRVKRKRKNVISPDGDGRSVKSRRGSPVSHSSDGGRAKSKSQIHVSSDSDGDERRVDRKRRERESLVYHSSDGGRAKSKRKSLVSSDSNDDGRRVGRKRRESESLVFHSSDGVRAKRKRRRHVSSDSDGDGRREERKRRERERESFVFHSSDGGRAKSKRQSLVSSDSDDDGRRLERKGSKRKWESRVFHSSDGGRAKSRRQSHVSSDSDDNGRRVERKRESLLFHRSDGGRAKSKRQSHLSSDSDDNERRVDRRRRERERSQSEREMPTAMRGDTREKGRK